MNNIKLTVILLSFFGLAGCKSTGQIRDEWTTQDKMDRFSNQAHHWGQKGDVIPNSGWSDYGYLQLDLGGSEYITFHQSDNEFFVERTVKKTGEVKFRALSIPGAGIFYFPKSNNSCAPDKIESLGIYAEMASFYLSESYSQGPNSNLPTTPVSAKGNGFELRFMQAIARSKKPWSLESVAKVTGPYRYSIKIKLEGIESSNLVEWSENEKIVISSSDPVSSWNKCWASMTSQDKDGNITTITKLNRTDDILSFGEVRDQLNEKL